MSIEKEFKTGKTAIRVEKPGRQKHKHFWTSYDGMALYRYPVENGDELYLEPFSNGKQ